RSSATGTPAFRFLEIGAAPNNIAVTINNLNFTNGDALIGNGGAILLNAGDLTMALGSFTNNRAGAGGAVFTTTTSVAPRIVSLNGVTFTSNAARSGAGGALVNTGSSALTLANCRFSSNVATTEGGAVAYVTGCTTATVTFSTITNNLAVQGPASGGGILITGANFRMGHTIVAGNTFLFAPSGPTGNGSDVVGAVSSLGWNFISD